MTTHELNEQERAELLSAARDAIRNALEGADYTPPQVGPSLKRPGGAFVTIRLHGQLRGCIGILDARRPLIDSVVDAAVAAATRDHRFSRLTQRELDEADLEISVLGSFVKVSDPQEIVIGRDGLYLQAGRQSGLLLPQVATEQHWDREELLHHICLKAGLAPGTWRRADARLERFTAEVFGER